MIEVRELRKNFDSLEAVKGISFETRVGEVFGLLGPNGAGKTTTISMISGLLDPTAGEVVVDGVPLRSKPKEVRRRLGVVPQEVAVYPDLTAAENLNFWGGIYGLGGSRLKERVAAVLKQVGLEDRAKDAVKTFSGGMKRRLNLGMGLIHEPRVLLLDEPTVGIDPQARNRILDVVRDVVRSGHTVLYTTHYLEEAEDLCDRLAIMDHGEILVQGSVPELKAHLGEGTLLTLSGSFAVPDLQALVERMDGIVPVEMNDGRAMLSVDRKAGVSKSLEQIFQSDLVLDDVSVKEPNLEDLFLKLTGRELRD